MQVISSRQTFTASLYAWCCILLFCAPTNAADDPAKPLAISTVGIAKRVESLVLPGAKLQVKPMTDRHQPFVLRVINVYPHGTDHRYDLEFYALEPGEYNLSEYLVRAENAGLNAAEQDLAGLNAAGQNPSLLPPVMVRVDATLQAGQAVPLPLGETRIPRLGGYRLMWIAGGAAWLAGLYALLFFGRKKSADSTETIAPPLSLADQLRPLVQAARDKRLAPEQRAALERTLIAFWCKRLKLGSTAPAQVMSTLREHAEAGPLVRSLEDWLHRPDSPQPVDIDALLKPYANVTDVEIPAAGAGNDSLSVRQGVAAV